METSELPSTAAPERRAPVSKKRRRRAQCCLSKLTLLQEEYPELSRHVQTAVDAIIYQRDRTREGDREAVLRVLEEWDATGLVIEDLVDEVEYLSRWDVGEVLKEIGHLVEYRDEYRPAEAGAGAPRQIIRLRRAAAAGWRESDAHARTAAGGRGGGVPALG
jgi:hypothetical protein